MSTTLILSLIGAVVALLLLTQLPHLIGLVVISDRKIGIVNKKFGPSLGASHIIACNGEAGIQAKVLTTGWHFGLVPWKYSVEKVDLISVPDGEIALVIAQDGEPMPSSRILGDYVPCENFTDAAAFLTGGGKKGQQIAKLRPGLHRINTRQFRVITSQNAKDFGVDARQLRVLTIPAEHIGIVTTNDGKPLPLDLTAPGGVTIAGDVVDGHSSFQDEQSFINAGGFRGLQEEVILPGTWGINPWFATVEVVPMFEIPAASVGIVNSYTGEIGADVSGVEFKHGHLVTNGKRGIWITGINPGLYPFNVRTKDIKIVPTSNFVLNWSSEVGEHKLDACLDPIHLRSSDGFETILEVRQIIHVPYDVAAKLIAQFGDINALVKNVLEPLVSNYFRNVAQGRTVLEFLNSRKERQEEATEYIRQQLLEFNINGVQTMIGDIQLPEALMQTLQDRKIAEESSATVQMQRDLAVQRQDLERANAVADQQRELVTSEQRVLIARQDAEGLQVRTEAEGKATETQAKYAGQAKLASATNEAEAITKLAAATSSRILQEGEAEAKVIQKKTEAIGQGNYAAIEVAGRLSTSNLKLVPDIMFGAGAAGSDPTSALLQMMASTMLKGAAAGTASAPPAVV